VSDKFTFSSAGEIQEVGFALARAGYTHYLLKNPRSSFPRSGNATVGDVPATSFSGVRSTAARTAASTFAICAGTTAAGSGITSGSTTIGTSTTPRLCAQLNCELSWTVV
jgi:hypothetical protein